MKVKMKKYNNIDAYHKDFPYEVEEYKTVNEAISTARKNIASIRNTFKFWGCKLVDKNGVLIHKLPSN